MSSKNSNELHFETKGVRFMNNLSMNCVAKKVCTYRSTHVYVDLYMRCFATIRKWICLQVAPLDQRICLQYIPILCPMISCRRLLVHILSLLQIQSYSDPCIAGWKWNRLWCNYHSRMVAATGCNECVEQRSQLVIRTSCVGPHHTRLEPRTSCDEWPINTAGRSHEPATLVLITAGSWLEPFVLINTIGSIAMCYRLIQLWNSIQIK